MKDKDKTKEQLVKELVEMRQQVAESETERKRAAELFRALINRSTVGIYIVQNGKFRFTNSVFRKYVGYSKEELQGMDPLSLVFPEDRDMVRQNAVKMLKRKRYLPYEFRYMSKGGETKWVIEAVVSIPYQGKQATLGSFMDITDHKRMEEELRRSERFYRTIMETAVDGYWCTDMEGRFLDVNNSYCQTIGYSQEELIGGMSISDVEVIEKPKAIAKHIKHVLKHGYDRFETRHRRKDGQVIDIEVSVRYLDLGEGQLVVFLRNITERKCAEEKLQELYEQETKLREGMETERKRRIEFTRVLVHELKTPLTPVLAASQLLAEELQEEALLRLVNSISQGALNLSNRIDELLDMVKGEIGILQLELRSVDPLPLLHSVADDIAPMTSSHGQSLILDLPPSLPPVRADESRLRQIMLNLLNNASKFTPSGGKITLRARKKDATLIVEVQDNGRGIAEEEQKRLFEPYYRVESDRQHLSGLGLGLTLCKTLVERFGGLIWVESRPGEGSTFGFSVPLEDS